MFASISELAIRKKIKNKFTNRVVSIVEHDQDAIVDKLVYVLTLQIRTFKSRG